MPEHIKSRNSEHLDKIVVSFILVCRNEEKHVDHVLESLCSEMELIGKTKCELVIVDGISEDKTVEKINDFFKRNSGIGYRFFSNPQKTLATGWNVGIQQTHGQFVIRPDAHGGLKSGYVLKGLEILKEHPEVVAVGGVLETIASGYYGEIIKEALSSPIGVGNSLFRTGLRSGYTDTAVFALYRKEIFKKTGYLNENLIRHQDNELHQRIVKSGGKLWTEKSMVAEYFCRDHPLLLFKQMKEIGFYLPDLFEVGGTGGLQFRHLAPFIFHFLNLVFWGASLANRLFLIGTIPFCFYAAILAGVSASKIFLYRDLKYINLIWIILFMHFSYAYGTALGLSRLILKRFNTDAVR